MIGPPIIHEITGHPWSIADVLHRVYRLHKVSDWPKWRAA
jgi:hypothetical protein